MSLVNDLDTEVENFKREYEKFERGNKPRNSCVHPGREEGGGEVQPSPGELIKSSRKYAFSLIFAVKKAIFHENRLTKDVYEGIFPLGFRFVNLAKL